MHGTLYCLENTLTDKIYIGKTVDFDRRMKEHSTGHGKARALHAAILKYGWQHFRVIVIEEIPVEDLDEAEAFWIAFLDTKAPNGYNLTDGGNGGKTSEAAKELMREAALRNVEDGTHLFLTDNPMKTPETVAKNLRARRTNRPTLDWVDSLTEDSQ